MLIEAGSDFYKMNVKFTGIFLLRFPCTAETYSLIRIFFTFFLEFMWLSLSIVLPCVSFPQELKGCWDLDLRFVTLNNKNVLLLFIIFISYCGLFSP